MQQDFWLPYHASHPNDFMLLGTDVFASGTNGALLAQFRINAGGLTFPLLRDCGDGSALSDTNLIKPYNQRDNYVVIDSKGVIRYHADDAWDYGNRYHPDELSAAIEAAFADLLAVPPPTSGPLTLEAAPNPFSRRIVLTLSNPAPGSTPARLRILDVAGREVAAFGFAAGNSAVSRVVWDGRSPDGSPLAAGLYLLQVESGAHRLTRRIVLTR